MKAIYKLIGKTINTCMTTIRGEGGGATPPTDEGGGAPF